MEFVILVGLAIVLVVLLGGATLVLNGISAPLWNAEISRMTKAVWGCGFALALGIAALWLGPALLATWPYWVGLLIFTVGGFKLADWLFLRRPRQERVITHADGSRAVVDAADGAGYRRLPAPDGTPTTGGKSLASRAKKALWD